MEAKVYGPKLRWFLKRGEHLKDIPGETVFTVIKKHGPQMLHVFDAPKSTSVGPNAGSYRAGCV